MKSLTKHALLLTTFATIYGCEVGPDYKPPQVKTMSMYGESRDLTVATTRPVIPISNVTTRPIQITQWWATFSDPELDSLVERAVKNNLDLKNATSRLRQARAQRGVTGSDLLPEINADGGYQRARGSKNITFPASIFTGGQSTPNGSAATATPGVATPAQTTPGSGAAATSAQPGGPASPLGLGGLPGTDTELYQAGFDASWEVDVFGGLRRSIESSDADTEAAIEDRRDVMVSLVAEVARTYVQLRSYQREAAIARENLQSQQDTLDLTKSRFNAGFVTDLDVARAAYQVASTAATLPTYDANIRVSIHQLGILLAQDPDALTDELIKAGTIPPVPPEVPIGMPADLLRRRPDIRRAERQLASASARIGVATADLFPKFSITGSFGFDSTKIKQLPDWSSRYFVLSPGFTWPIFDAGRIRNNIEVQKEIAGQAATTYQNTILNALREVEDSLAQYRSEQLRRKALTDAVDQAKIAVDLAKQQYEKGVIDFLTVLDTERSLFSAQDILAQSDAAISSDLVALYKALGGGWEVDPAQDR